MLTLLRTGLIAFVLCFAAPLSAHGPNEHEDEKAEQQAETLSEGPEIEESSSALDETREPDLTRAMKNLHPSLTHFPIALLISAALAELLSIGRSSMRLRHAASVMAALGGVGATIAAIFGWVHTGLWIGGEAAMHWHRWIGTALGLAGPLIAWLALRRSENRLLLRVLLLLAALAVTAQGWLGGELGHGVGHLFA